MSRNERSRNDEMCKTNNRKIQILSQQGVYQT